MISQSILQSFSLEKSVIDSQKDLRTELPYEVFYHISD